MTRFLAVLVSLCALTCGLASAQPKAFNPPKVAAKAKGCGAECVCGSECKCDEGKCPGGCPVDPVAASVMVSVGSAGGSGTVVATDGGKSLVLTNRHVVEMGGPCSVVAGETRYPARVVAINRGPADLALIVAEATLPVAALADAEPPRNALVRQWGRDWHGQGRQVPKVGQAIGVSGADFKTTIESVSGDSGCGVFDESGRLVGVNWGFDGYYNARGPQNCVPLADVRAFLRAEMRSAFPRVAAVADVARAAPRAVVKWVSYATGKAEADLSGKPCVVLFTSPESCVYCRMLEAGALSSSDVKAALADCVCIRVDVSTAEGQRQLAEYARHGDPVTSWPTIKVYRNGSRVADHSGNLSAETLLGLLR